MGRRNFDPIFLGVIEMKKLFQLLLITLLMLGCSKKEEKFELFSPVAFAYALDNSWELNASCQAKGFAQTPYKGKFGAQVSFVLDLKKPDGTIKEDVQHGRVDQLANNGIDDLAINTQVQLDSTYKAGKYVLIFRAKDDYTGRKAKIEREFEL